MGQGSLAAAPAAPTLLGPVSGTEGRGGETELEAWAWGGEGRRDDSQLP